MSTTTHRRPTRQQAAVIERLGRSEDFTSAQDLHARMREAGDKVGLATVYRTLTSLAAAGEVDMIRTDEGEAVYRMCSTGHHHHLVCRDCGRTVEIEGPAVERWADRVGAEHGFTDVSHTLEVFGRCQGCAPA
ncbi:Fur family transcriptional regulator [Ornithinimicrobium pekingense]|uniref:Transcriptional repressor n=1 Tax=Ornithinimicrobium pekingense TaxID=384677 RepID=A0ABQ2F8H8_9MICO|nr:transcriptional repressor [Ornithinimicrobium pekingense]GGK61560.1 transcriptional repressor [Ornithinimicrobium pekingense]